MNRWITVFALLLYPLYYTGFCQDPLDSLKANTELCTESDSFAVASDTLPESWNFARTRDTLLYECFPNFVIIVPDSVDPDMVIKVDPGMDPDILIKPPETRKLEIPHKK